MTFKNMDEGITERKNKINSFVAQTELNIQEKNTSGILFDY